MRGLIVLFVLGVIVGCRKEPPLNRCGALESCEMLPISTSPIGYQSIPEGTQYRSSCFNPNNPDELVYYSENSIRKYSLESGYSKKIADNVSIYGNISWGRSGWIIFYDWVKGGIWKVKEDGTELGQLYNAPYIFCSFRNDGEKIIISSGNDFSNYPLKIIDINGNVNTTLTGSYNGNYLGFREMPWNLDNEILVEIGTQDDYGLALYELDNNEVSQILKISYAGGKFGIPNDIADIKWSVDGDYYYYTTIRGIFKTNKYGTTHRQIKVGCNSKRYKSISVSENRIIAEREDTWVIEKNERLGYQHKIVMMDLDGCNEEVILE